MQQSYERQLSNGVSSASDVLLHVAKRIRLIRNIRKMTLQKTAKMLGISRKQLQNYEKAQTNIGVARLWQIANLMQVDTSFFIEGLNSSNSFWDDESLEIVTMIKNIKDENVKKHLVLLLKNFN